MILILSKSCNEISTDRLIDYLEKYNANYIRINGADLLGSGSVYFDVGNCIRVNDTIIPYKEVNVVFNRRWYDPDEIKIQDLPFEYDTIDSYSVREEVLREFLSLSQYFKSKFKHALWIPNHKSVNKLNVIERADSLGLRTPKSFICSKKTDLENIHQFHPRLITKSIGDIFHLKSEDRLLSFFTTVLTADDIERMPEYFFPSLIQEELIKDYEIRTFYFFGELYSMAIYSQSDEKTLVDFRNYNHKKPNRTVPYKLPFYIENKIRMLMNDLGLNTGSLDFIFHKDEYYFLEVNPVGQFGMVDYPCGYNLYSIIAKQLVNLDDDEK